MPKKHPSEPLDASFDAWIQDASRIRRCPCCREGIRDEIRALLKAVNDRGLGETIHKQALFERMIATCDDFDAGFGSFRNHLEQHEPTYARYKGKRRDR